MWIIVLPFCALVIWGMILAWSPSFSFQFGIGISLIGIFLLFIFLGFADWYGHSWHMTKMTIGFFIGATIAVFFYCFAVIFLPNYFSYNGTTAIFMAINFIFSTALTYLKTESFSNETKTKERFIKLDILVDNIIENKCFDGPAQITKEKLVQVMTMTEEKNRRYFLITKIALILAYILTFVAYFVVIIT